MQIEIQIEHRYFVTLILLDSITKEQNTIIYIT